MSLTIGYLAYIATTAYHRSQTPDITRHTPKSSSVVPAKKVSIGLPVRLTIPKIKVDAPILQLGLTPEGNMDVPADLANTGWYKYGPPPGQIGSAVIAGHLEGIDKDGVFINLGKLVKGDVIFVKNDAGETISFTVRETRLYRQEERPSEVFNTTEGAHLNLITCTGTWNNVQQRYSKRLVVFADKSS